MYDNKEREVCLPGCLLATSCDDDACSLVESNEKKKKGTKGLMKSFVRLLPSSALPVFVPSPLEIRYADNKIIFLRFAILN